MVKKLLTTTLLALTITIAVTLTTATAVAEETTPDGTSFEGVCAKVKAGTAPYDIYPECAETPANCASENGLTPLNCMYLEEPIGGEPGYDLYKISCIADPSGSGGQICNYTLWHGEAIVGRNERGPVQAILAFQPGKEHQGPLGLLYSYLGVVYKFMSGIIVGFVILIAIIGGIRMTTSYGNQESFKKGRDMIIKALIGMALWFLASLILYTINPTFFVF
jgi:hypothetical protein